MQSTTTEILFQNYYFSEYYYKFAQALRGVKRYDESRQWLRKYLKTEKDSEEIETSSIRMSIKAKKLSNQSYRKQSEVSDSGFVKEIIYLTARAQDVKIRPIAEQRTFLHLVLDKAST